MFVLPPRRCADHCHRVPPFKKSYKKEVRSFVPHITYCFSLKMVIYWNRRIIERHRPTVSCAAGNAEMYELDQ